MSSDTLMNQDSAELAALREEIEKLKAEREELASTVEDLREKYLKARETAIEKEEYAALLSSNKAMKAYRKAHVKLHGTDPFDGLRPHLTDEEAGIRANVDSSAYKGEELVLRGWAFDLRGMAPKVMIRDRSRIVPFTELWYPRPDVNDQLELPADMATGFSIRIRLSDIRHEILMVEFENEYGYVSREVRVLLDEKARKAYLDANAAPTYAIDNAGYDDWFHDNRVSAETLKEQSGVHFPYEPLISIVIPLYNTPKKFLIELMDSLVGQSYKNIEICLADGSTVDTVGKLIRETYGHDVRVKYQRLAVNTGISGNTNEAIKMATGDFIMLSDHDDTLELDACFEIVKALNEDPEIDAVYTDEDKLMLSEGVYFSPNFKPDFNIDLLRSNNYITHIFCVRKSVADAIAEPGGVYERSEFDGAQDYDFILRCVEKSRKVCHVPKFLYHWRAHASSTAGNPESKMYAYENGRRAIEAHLKRVGIKGHVALAEDIGSYRTTYDIEGEPLVSIIIPNKDLKTELSRCIDSIFEKSTYRNFEILIVENNSVEQETFTYYEEVQKAHDNVRVLTWKDVFNYSAINNFAVREAKGDYLLFLNNDIEVISPDFLSDMLGICMRADVGAVGARLYYPDDTLQHCGIVVGIGGIAGHILRREKMGSGGYFGRISKTQDVSAVTAACMMMPKAVFEEVGGFDETYAVAYNDVDLCLKVREKNYLVVYDAWALLYHHESLSRGSDDEDVSAEKHERQMREARRLRSRWPKIFEEGDPYFNPNLDYNASEYVLVGTIPPNYSALQAVSREVAEK